jgi:tetratricopeptide (TPR) repeat protein
LRQTAGSDSVSRVLDLVREGRDALQAVADVGADGDSAAFMSGWKDYLRSLKLVSKKLASARLVLDGAGDEVDSDPVLGSRADLAQFVRLGDILYDHQRADAALVEYRKAVPPDEPASPVLTAHTAEALTTLGRKGEAMALLKANILDYPESAATRRAYAKLLQAEGRPVEALAQYRAAADLDPFDPDTQSALSDLYGSRGEKTLSERHARYGRILRSTEPLPDSPRSR